MIYMYIIITLIFFDDKIILTVTVNIIQAELADTLK